LSSSKGLQIDLHPRPHRKISNAGQKLSCFFFAHGEKLSQFQTPKKRRVKGGYPYGKYKVLAHAVAVVRLLFSAAQMANVIRFALYSPVSTGFYSPTVKHQPSRVNNKKFSTYNVYVTLMERSD